MSAVMPVRNDKVARLLQEAVALHRGGNLEGAELVYRKAIRANPRDPDALNLLGVVRIQRGDAKEGVALIKRALSVRDDFPDAHVNIALAYWQHLGDRKEAERHLRRAVLHSRTPQIYCHLGNLLRDDGRHAEALAAFRAAAECDPRSPEGYIMYARALRMTNDMQTMLSVAQEGLKLAPQNPTLHLLSSEAFFALGRLPEGWRAYRWRFKSLENRIVPKDYLLPMWEGESLDGRCLLIWTEQGVGDEIMYANVFADAVAASKRCLIQCSPRLAPVMRRSFPAAEVYGRDLTAEELRGVDVQAPAGSLGEWLRPSFNAFPSHSGYIAADPTLRDRLRAKYRSESETTLLVGIAWKSTSGEAAPLKSVNLLEWGPILQVPGATFVNLQYGACALELQEAMRGFGVTILQDATIDPLRDMDGFTAQVAAMDLVITSSNTTAHIAGALGVPTLCLLPSALGRGRRWYWFAEHDACPWYPTMRRFVQSRDGDWLDVIRSAGLALVDIAAARGTAVAPHLSAMARAFAEIGRPDDAQAYFLRLASEKGSGAQAYAAIADLKIAALDAEGGFAFLDRAIAADPTYWQAFNKKGIVLVRLNRFDEAIAVYRAGLARNPTSPELHSNLGAALLALGRSQEALHHFEDARRHGATLEVKTQAAVALNTAAALDALGRMDEALAILDEIILQNPDNVDAHYNRSRGLLSIGRFREGWPEYEWRLKRPGANVRYEAFPHVKRWNGEELRGKRVLIWTEQGIGDEILTASMVPDAVEAAAHVTLLCSPRLVPLFRRSFPKAAVDERKEPLPVAARDPRLSYQLSTSDLGRAFRSEFSAFPERGKFLAADPARQGTIRRKYERLRPATRLVGISWSSRGNPEMGWLKSNNLAAWRPILMTRGVSFVNLQYGDCASELAQVREQLGIEILNDPDVNPLEDLDGFAAQVAAMDLVISTSNTTVHMAGGLGIATWVLAPQGRGRHWYWFKGLDDSPWYPSLRFVCTGDDGSWEGAIARCAEDLGAWALTHGESGNT